MARRKVDEAVKTFGVSVLPSIIEEIEMAASKNRWTKASFGGDLLILGWAIYKQTGLFEVTPEMIERLADSRPEFTAEVPKTQYPYNLGPPRERIRFEDEDEDEQEETDIVRRLHRAG